MNKHRKLKNFLIYPEFQSKLIMLFMSISLIAPLIIFAFQSYSFKQQIKNGQMMNLPDTHPYFIFYKDFQSDSMLVFLASVGVSLLLSLIFGLLFSHRIAGPLVKMKNHFEAVGKNPMQDTTLRFRENDFFKDLAEAYNLKFKKVPKS